MRTCLAALALVMLMGALPGAYAGLCERTGPLKADCKAILAAGLAPEEQREAVGALLSGDSFLPAHDTALAWNRQVLKDTAGKPAPTGAAVKSQGSIRNAWVELLGLHPSVRQGDAFFHSREGVALLASGYTIVPYQDKLGWDCRTDYRPEKPYAELRLLADGVSQGMGPEVKYRVGGDALFTARLDVSQTTYVDHYSSYTYCCRVGCGCGLLGCYCVCSSYCTDCTLSNTETWLDRVIVEDTLDAKLLSTVPEASLAPVEEYGGTVKAVFSPDETENTRLSAGGRDYTSQATVYSAEVEAPPFETLTITASPTGPAGNSTLLLPAGSACSLEVQGPFGTMQLPCSTDYTGTRLALSTDRLFYRAGDTIELSVSGVGEAEVEYANRSYNASERLHLVAESPFTRITGRAAGQEASVVVGVLDRSAWRVLWQVLLLGLVCAATVSFMRNWLGGKGLWPAA